MNSNFIEFFLSIQGEGLYIGTKQLFVRFAECNLNCNYCDTNNEKTENCKVYYNLENNQVEHIPNSIDVKSVLKIISNFDKENFSFISITGGEPLLQAVFLKEILKKLNKKIILETNGTLHTELSKVIDFVDIVSMDFKFNSIAKTNINYNIYQPFVEIASKKELYIKLVIDSNLLDDEIDKFCSIVSNKNIPVIVQPVMQKNSFVKKDIIKSLQLQTFLLKYFNDVRILPQIHKILDIL